MKKQLIAKNEEKEIVDRQLEDVSILLKELVFLIEKKKQETVQKLHIFKILIASSRCTPLTA